MTEELINNVPQQFQLTEYKTEIKNSILVPLRIIAILTAVIGVLSLIFEVSSLQINSLPVYISRLLTTVAAFVAYILSMSGFGKKHPELVAHFLLFFIVTSFCLIIYQIHAPSLIYPPDKAFSFLQLNSSILSLIVFVVGLSFGWHYFHQVSLAGYTTLLLGVSLFLNNPLSSDLRLLIEPLTIVAVFLVMSIVAGVMVYKYRYKSFNSRIRSSDQGNISLPKSDESGTEYKSFIDFSPEGIYRSTADGKFLLINQALVKILGYDSQDELMKIDTKNLFAEQTELKNLEELLEKQEQVENYRVVLNKKDGTEIIVRLNQRVIKNFQGEAEYYEGCIADITQQVKSEQERKRELEVLRFEKKKANHETNSAVYTSNIKTQFLANMSHEIRTPMNSVLGFLTLIENGLFESEDELKDFARNAKISADSLLDIINNILDISKIEAGKMELYEDDFNIQDEIDKAQSIVTPSAKEKGLKLSCVIEENVPRTLIGDATRYRQVLVNLLGNAVKYSESGEINIKVEVAGKTEATAKILTVVKDQGPGIAQDKIPTLFKPYSQVRSKKWVKEKGTGLGLMICKEFVNLMGGEISIESKVGEGTKISFTVVLTVEKNFLADREKVKPERDFRKIEKRKIEEKTKPNQDIPKIKEPDISETVKTETIIPEQVFEETADTFLSEEELEKTLQNEDDNSYEINSLAGSQKSKKRLLLVEDNPISQVEIIERGRLCSGSGIERLRCNRSN